jgi:hypothetical protein
MVRLIAEQAVQAALGRLTELVEICDAEGKILGYFAPASLPYAAASAKVLARIDWAEIERRRQSESQGFTTKQVFEHLLTLTEDEPTRAYLQEKIAGLAAREKSDSGK